MNKNFCVVVMLMILGISLGMAQEPLRPKAPYVAPVPKNAHWLVTMKYPHAAAERPTSIDIAKTEDIKRLTISYSTEKPKEIYAVRGYYLTETAQGPELMNVDRSDLLYPFLSDEFVFIGRLKAEQFKEVVKINGVTCFHFQNEISEVWIAADSMLPVAARKDGMMAYYQFFPPTEAPVILPPAESAFLQRHENACNAFRGMR
jgi:hypothetical protein